MTQAEEAADRSDMLMTSFYNWQERPITRRAWSWWGWRAIEQKRMAWRDWFTNSHITPAGNC